VSPRRHFGGAVGAEPNPGVVVGNSHLADPLVVVPPPHSPVHGVPGLLEHSSPRPLLGPR